MLASDKPWGDTQLLEGRGASMGPQPVAQRHAGDTVAQSTCCRDELGAPEVVMSLSPTISVQKNYY